MKKSTSLIVGGLIFVSLLIVVALKFNSRGLVMNPDSLYQKLVGATEAFQRLSLINHILMIILGIGVFVGKNFRRLMLTLFVIHLSVGTFIAALAFGISANLVYFPFIGICFVVAVLRDKIDFDFSRLRLIDKIIGGLALAGSFWYLALFDHQLAYNALLYSPVGVVNCPTTLAICGILLLNSQYNRRSYLLEITAIGGAFFFGGLGFFTMSVYFDILLISVAGYMGWRLWRETRAQERNAEI